MIVAGFIASLKVAMTRVLRTYIAGAIRRATEITVGGAHAVLAVVKVIHSLLASALPLRFWAPVVMVAV